MPHGRSSMRSESLMDSNAALEELSAAPNGRANLAPTDPTLMISRGEPRSLNASTSRSLRTAANTVYFCQAHEGMGMCTAPCR